MEFIKRLVKHIAYMVQSREMWRCTLNYMWTSYSRGGRPKMGKHEYFPVPSDGESCPSALCFLTLHCWIKQCLPPVFYSRRLFLLNLLKMEREHFLLNWMTCSLGAKTGGKKEFVYLFVHWFGKESPPSIWILAEIGTTTMFRLFSFSCLSAKQQQ